jgi:uncharacterized protein (DUF952 family)
MRFYSLMLIYKICRAAEWARVEREYSGSVQDRADGFLHFSTQAQLAGTLERHYAGADDLVLVAVEEKSLGPALRWEYAASRGEDFPHLYGSLPLVAVTWVRSLARRPDGSFDHD